jgi:RimJ/RimL family protein N-acetyltransferase
MAWPPSAGITLAGSIVTVSPASPRRDADGLFAGLDFPEVWAHLSRPRPSDPGEVATRLERDRRSGWFPWTVRLARDYRTLKAGTIVGMSSYLDVSQNDARLEIGATAYSPSVWASGVNPETKFLLLKQAFEVLGAGRVTLVTDVRNVRSQRAIARLGARYEGTVRRHKRRPDGSVRDTILFSILAEEWPEVRAGLESRVAAALS